MKVVWAPYAGLETESGETEYMGVPHAETAAIRESPTPRRHGPVLWTPSSSCAAEKAPDGPTLKAPSSLAICETATHGFLYRSASTHLTEDDKLCLL